MDNSMKSFVIDPKKVDNIVSILTHRMDIQFNHPKYVESELKMHSIANKDDEFEFVKLSTLVNIKSGKTPKIRTYQKSKIDDIPIVRTSNIRPGEININDNMMYSEMNNVSTIVDKGDVLLTIVGANLNIVGRAACYDYDFPASVNQNIVVLKLESEKIYNQYLMMYLNSPLGKKQIERLSKMGNQVNLNSYQVGEIGILIPSLDSQLKYVNDFNIKKKTYVESEIIIKSLIKDIDSIINNYFELENTLSPVLNSSIVSSITSLRWDYEYYNLTKNAQIEVLRKKSKYEFVKLKDILHDIFRGDTPKLYTNDGVKILQVNNIDPFELNLINCKFISESEYNKKVKFQLNVNDILITGIGPPLGEAVIVKKVDLPLSAYNHISVLRVNEEIVVPGYIVGLLNSSIIQEQIKKYTFGVRQKYLTNEWINELEVPLISTENQIILSEEMNIVIEKYFESANTLNLIRDNMFALNGLGD